MERIRQVVAEGKKKIVLDMSEIAWMDSVGIGILVACFMTVRNRFGELKVARPTKKIKMLLEVTNLLAVIRTFDTVEAAVESFSS
jgi:anti-sigma B factor antagonist